MNPIVESPLTTSARKSPSAWASRGDALTVTPSGQVVETAPSLRLRRALLEYARDGLVTLARHRDDADMSRYAEALELIAALVEDGGPTPQVSDNGDGGIAVEWLVNRAVLTLDVEGPDSVYLVGRDANGKIELEEETVVRGFMYGVAAAKARLFLRELAAGIRRPISLAG